MSTWTAAFSIFGVVALTLWLARLAAARGWVVAVPAALLLAVIGVASNYRYELTFPALPLTLLALVLLPVSDLEHRAAGRRAKWLLGSAYGVGFGAVLVANRMLVSDACGGGGCYSGVSLALGPTMFRTFAINVASSIPGTGREEVLALLRSESVPTDGLWTPTLWSVLTALALVVTLALAWRGGSPRQTESAGPEETRAQAVLCVMAAALLIAGGLGAAAVMSLSERSADRRLHEIGELFRHSVVTWTGLAFGAVLLVLALGLWRPRLAVPSFVALALVMALLVATRMPADGPIMVANTSRLEPSVEVFDEVVRGETGDDANQRRCRVLRDVDRELGIVRPSHSYAAPRGRSSASGTPPSAAAADRGATSGQIWFVRLVVARLCSSLRSSTDALLGASAPPTASTAARAGPGNADPARQTCAAPLTRSAFHCDRWSCCRCRLQLGKTTGHSSLDGDDEEAQAGNSSNYRAITCSQCDRISGAV